MLKHKNILKTNTAIAWYLDSTLFVECLPDAVITLEDAVEHIERSSEIIEERDFVQLIDMRRLKSITREARVLYSRKNSNLNCKAVALLVSSPLSRVIANFFLGMNKPDRPIKLFTNKEKAITWLKTHK